MGGITRITVSMVLTPEVYTLTRDELILDLRGSLDRALNLCDLIATSEPELSFPADMAVISVRTADRWQGACRLVAVPWEQGD